MAREGTTDDGPPAANLCPRPDQTPNDLTTTDRKEKAVTPDDGPPEANLLPRPICTLSGLTLFSDEAKVEGVHYVLRMYKTYEPWGREDY